MKISVMVLLTTYLSSKMSSFDDHSQKINELEELGVFIGRESGVIALAITPPDVLETCWFCKDSTEVRDRSLARAVPRSR